MRTGIRTFIDDLKAAGHLVETEDPVPIDGLAAYVAKTGKAVLFRNVPGYQIPVVSGLVDGRERIAIGFRCDPQQLVESLRRALDHPVAPRQVESGPVREVVVTGDDVDLFELPIPIFFSQDGGPMITAGVVIGRDPEYGMNSGVYRFLVRERNLTGIDIVTPNDLRRFAERALALGKPLPISINIGTHPSLLISSLYRAPLGTNEIEIAGALQGAPVELTPCAMVDVPCIADAEIVLEGEILPVGWTYPEGRFGEFTKLMGDLHWNPLVRIKAVARRSDAIYYALHMPMENVWLAAPSREAALRRLLREAGVSVAEINVTPGGCCFFHAVVSIRKQPGDGKNAILAALADANLKHVIVVDDDIDVFDHNAVEWAIATRVQADRDVLIVSGTRAKPLDPSLALRGRSATTAKMGIDATISEDVPRHRFQLPIYVQCAESDGGQSKDTSQSNKPLEEQIHAVVAQGPIYYAELYRRFAGIGFPAFSRAVGELHAGGQLWQDPEGRLCLKDSPHAAKVPAGRV